MYIFLWTLAWRWLVIMKPTTPGFSPNSWIVFMHASGSWNGMHNKLFTRVLARQDRIREPAVVGEGHRRDDVRLGMQAHFQHGLRKNNLHR